MTRKSWQQAASVSVVSSGAGMDALTLVATPLRRAGVATDLSCTGKIRAQIRRAEADWIVICEDGRYRLYDRHTGMGQEASPDEIVAGLVDLFTDDWSDPTPMIERFLDARVTPCDNSSHTDRS